MRARVGRRDEQEVGTRARRELLRMVRACEAVRPQAVRGQLRPRLALECEVKRGSLAAKAGARRRARGRQETRTEQTHLRRSQRACLNEPE